MNSRQKGARGERELAKLLGGRRTGHHQSQRNSGSADISADLENPDAWDPRFHWEGKRQERIEIVKWCRQAEGDCPDGKVPIVAFRTNGRPHHPEPWRVTLRLEDFLRLIGAPEGESIAPPSAPVPQPERPIR